jgi:hypothetical protein
VAWVPVPVDVLARVGCGLAERYVEGDGVLRWPGERPGPGWHGHGWVARVIEVFDGRGLRARRVYRHRWRLAGTNRTTLSRCPDEIPRLWFAVTVVVLVLWAWLSCGRGAHAAEPLHDALNERPSTRTAQRWLARALPRATTIEQGLRTAILDEESVPWPAERMFPGGLPPPDSLRRRPWADPEEVCRLYRGLLWVVGGAVRLKMPIPILLARARGRWTDPTNPSLI